LFDRILIFPLLLLSGMAIVLWPKEKMVEKIPAYHQKKFDHPFFEIRTDKIQNPLPL